MHGDKVRIVFGVPESDLETVLTAMGEAGAGVVGQYTFCSFSAPGVGRFLPGGTANPHIGAVGQVNQVTEMRVETFCDRSLAKAVVQAIRAAHPYEEPAIYIMPLISEDEL